MEAEKARSDKKDPYIKKNKRVQFYSFGLEGFGKDLWLQNLAKHHVFTCLELTTYFKHHKAFTIQTALLLQ